MGEERESPYMKFKIFYLFFICWFASCKGQKPFGTDHLKLEKIIEMPEVKGRIDHMAVNLKDKVIYVAALGNNSVEVIDLQKNTTIHSIKGLDEPQGVAYLPRQNEIVIANGGNGNCVFYNATTYKIITTLHLPGDADNVRYSASGEKIYVGYGDGGIAVIDAASHKQTGDVKLPAHPESFQIDQKNNLMFVNLPDAKSVAVIDLRNMKVISTWKTNNLKANFPMALDTTDNHVMIGYRHPSVLVIYDVKTGKKVGRTDLVSDADDIFYYEANQQVLASGGGGSINIYKKDNNGFKQVANIPTRYGARTSLLIPYWGTYVLAERANGGRSAAIAVYKTDYTNK